MREIVRTGEPVAVPESLLTVRDVAARLNVSLGCVYTLAERGLLVRAGNEFGLEAYIRITVGPVPLMELVTEAIGRLAPTLAP